MKRIDRLHARLLLGITAVVSVGCGHAGDLTSSRDPDARPVAVVEDADGDGVVDPLPVPDEQDVATAQDRGAAALERLAALQVVEIGGIVDGNPEEGPNCYNVPCTEEEFAAQVDRLEVLVDAVAVAVEAGPLELSAQTLATADEGSCGALNADIATSLASLDALHVVAVTGLVGGDASHCYCFGGGDPCVEAVIEKAGLLARAVEAAQDFPPAQPGTTTE